MSPSKKILYITYLGLLEPIPQSQVVPYLLKLSKEMQIFLVSYEKPQLLKESKQELEKIKRILDKHRIQWYHLKYHKYPKILSSYFDILVGSILVLHLILSKRISIVHARSNIPIAIAYFLRKFLVFKILYDRRGIMGEDHIEHSGWKKEGFLYRFALSFEKKVIRKSDVVVVITDRMRNVLMHSERIKAESIITIPCCTDLQHFKPLKEKEIKIPEVQLLKNKFVFIYTGSVGTYNLLSEMFDFLKVAKFYIPNAHLLILTPQMQTALSMLNMQSTIGIQDVTIRKTSQQDMPQYLSLAQAGLIFRQKSATAIAACPTKMGEYLACGLPIIAFSEIGDIQYLIESHHIGVTFKEYNKSQYEQTILKFIQLLNHKKDLPDKCRKFSENFFSLTRGADLYLKAYDQMLKR